MSLARPAGGATPLTRFLAPPPSSDEEEGEDDGAEQRAPVGPRAIVYEDLQAAVPLSRCGARRQPPLPNHGRLCPVLWQAVHCLWPGRKRLDCVFAPRSSSGATDGVYASELISGSMKRLGILLDIYV